MSREGDFLSRWARRKAEAREAETGDADKGAGVAPDTAAEGSALADQEAAQNGRPATEDEIAALPDPDSLEHGADFKPFLRPGVPAALRQRALRRLWRVNPAIGFLDGMNEYDLDYTDAATVVENLKTAYQVGRGFVVAEEEEAPAKLSADAAEQDEAATAGGGLLSEVSADNHPETGTPTSNRDGDDSADVVAGHALEHAEGEVSGAQGGEAGGVAATKVAERESPAQTPEPGQAAARRWARFSTAIER